MDAIIGIGLFLFFVGLSCYNYYTGQSIDLRTGTQLLISGIGSFLILGPSVLHKVKNIRFKIPKPEPKPNPKPEEEDDNMDDIDCDEKSLTDFKCLLYLKSRAEEIKSQEAIDLVVKLNSLLFSSESREQKNPEVKE